MWVSGATAYLGNPESQEICDQDMHSLKAFSLAYTLNREMTQEW